MKCPRCEEKFKLIEPQVIQDMEGKVECTQIYCPACRAVIRNWPRPMIVDGEQR